MPVINVDVASICCIPHLRGCVASSTINEIHTIEIPASRNDVLTIRRPGQPQHSIRMPTIDVDVASIPCIPYLYCLIATCGGDALAIGRPAHRIYKISMPKVGVDMPSICCIPHLHRFIPRGRGDALAIRRPAHRIYKISMPPVGVDMAPICCIPHLHHGIVTAVGMEEIPASRGDALAIG